MASILLLEDDELLAATLSCTLQAYGFLTHWVRDTNEFDEATYHKTFDLMVMDMNPVRGCGTDLLVALRQAGIYTPALFVSLLDDVASISAGFLAGADDYVKKPYNLGELIVRIKAVLRRHHRIESEFLHVGNFRFHLYQHALYEGDERIVLTPYQSKIVALFFRNRNTTVEKIDMLYELSGKDESSEASLRVMISYLRKIGLPIQTQWGKGYRLEA